MQLTYQTNPVMYLGDTKGYPCNISAWYVHSTIFIYIPLSLKSHGLKKRVLLAGWSWRNGWCGWLPMVKPGSLWDNLSTDPPVVPWTVMQCLSRLCWLIYRSHLKAAGCSKSKSGKMPSRSRSNRRPSRRDSMVVALAQMMCPKVRASIHHHIGTVLGF